VDVPPLAAPAVPPVWGGVVLREFRDEDVAMVMDLATDAYLPLIGSLPFRADRGAALAYVARQRGRRLEGVGWSFCVAGRADDAALGGAGLWVVPGDPHRMTAGYVVAPSARGRGVAQHALSALTRFAWTLPGVDRVELVVEPWNTASLKTAERAGYARCGPGAELQELRGRRVAMVRFAAVRPDEL
jgi:ribosomal-protein-alanine N-acetyltransferase